MKINPEEQRLLIPDQDVREAFLRRDDISILDPKEQERRWQVHKKHLDGFRVCLSKAEVLDVWIDENETAH